MPQKLRDPYNRSRNHREGKKKNNFYGFPWGVFMDYLRNQTRKNLRKNGMRDGFYWESNGDWNNNNNNNNNNINNNNLIRLVPGTNESGRRKNGLFRDSLL